MFEQQKKELSEKELQEIANVKEKSINYIAQVIKEKE
jgi:hypothetical protein